MDPAESIDPRINLTRRTFDQSRISRVFKRVLKAAGLRRRASVSAWSGLVVSRFPSRRFIAALYFA